MIIIKKEQEGDKLLSSHFSTSYNEDIEPQPCINIQ